MSCIICGRRLQGRYCQHHTKAYMNLCNGFERWSHALDIGWWEYLEKIEENQKTGKWVVEVCKDLLNRKKI